MKRFINIIMVAVSVMLMAAANVFAYKVGDKITFGSYPFYEDGREKAIDWIILDIDKNNNALVISDYALDNVSYNEKTENITWEKSTIRKWLNNEFLNKAFTATEQGKIKTTTVITADNKGKLSDGTSWHTRGGEATNDKLFLLSIEEANTYFKSNDDRKAYPTPYANLKTEDSTTCWWWLRSPGGGQFNAAYVYHGGYVISIGGDVSISRVVRPALKINLNNLKSTKISDRSSKENIFAYKVGDIITFGSYPYEEDGTKRPVEWRILEITGNNALVISKYALDFRKFDEVSNKWETSEIRQWLKIDFYNEAFNDYEKNIIIKYDKANSKVFLLSVEEVIKYFKNVEDRKVIPTPYATGRGEYKYNDGSWWWLRSPNIGFNQDKAEYVAETGNMYRLSGGGQYVHSDEGSVRPALKINLNDLKSAPTNVGNSSTDVFVYEVGDKITFGSYPFYEDGREKAIEWRILDIDKENNALVISDYALDNVNYNKRWANMTWEKSSIRKWLNNDFLKKAFTVEQRSKIIESQIVNKDNFKYNTKGGNDTFDKLFFLSIEEANKYFENDKARIAYPTPYAKSRKSVNGNIGISNKYFISSRGGSCWWWLRSSGKEQNTAAFVSNGGGVDSVGDGVYDDRLAVRVAFKINLNNLKSPQIDNGSSVAEFTKPPRLSVGNVSYSDSTNSNVLMADGEGKISFTVANAAAGGTAYNLKAIVSAKDSNGNAVQGISFENTNEIGNIAPGKSVNVNIPIKTGENLAGGTAAFTITFSEANGFGPDSKTIKIQTVRTDPPDVQLAEFGLDDTEGELSFGNGNGIVEPGESIVLNLALLNNGDGITKDTKITFESGDAEIHFIDNTQFSKGNIQPGGKVSLNTAFSISRRYKGSSTLPIKMKITDERKRFSKEIPLNIALKRSYPKTEIINIASNYKKPQKIKTQTDPLNNIPDAKTQNKYGVAVIIGVRNYENKVPPVLFAINDAQTVRDYVVKALGYNPDNIIYVENPTKGQMEEIFGTDKTHKGRLFNYIKPDRSDVLVYYAGHGAPDQGTKTAFFVPKDANPDYIRIGGYSMDTFYANLAKLPAKNITVLTDACFSGQTGDGRMIIKHASPLAVSAKLPGTVNSKISVFNAGRDSEMASWYAEKQHGLFTYYFLLGLGGQADTNKDKTITAGEIDAYLQENVPGIARRLYNREQHPVFTGNRNATIAEYK